MKRWITKSLALLLTLTMLCSLLPFTAAAEDTGGKTDLARTGSSDSCIKLYPSRGSSAIEVVNLSYGDPEVNPYGSMLDYDPAANTLTMTDLNAMAIDICNMGEVKLVVNGYNTLADITVWGGSDEDFGLTVTGSGTLELSSGLGVEGDTDTPFPSSMTIEKDVNLIVPDGLVYVFNSSAENPLVVKGRELSGGAVGHPKLSTATLRYSYSSGVRDSVRVYRNTTRPFWNYSAYEDLELFCVVGLTARVYRSDDHEYHDCYEFEIFEAVEEDDEIRIGSAIDYIYVWDDSLMYRIYEEDLDRLRISDIDPNYVEVDMHNTYEEMTTLVNADGNYLWDIHIVPQNSGELNRPVVTTTSLPDATQGKAYSARLTAQAGNSGGSIAGYSLRGAASWLSIDAEGNITGTAPGYGIYKMYVSAFEQVGEKQARSAEKLLTVKVDAPENIVTFAKTIANGVAHSLTITDSSGTVVKSFYLGAKTLNASTVLDLEGLPDGSYTATLTGELSGSEIIYNGNSADFTITSGEKTRVILDPDTEIAYPESSVILSVDGFENAKKLKNLLATVTLSSGKTVKKEISRKETVIPNCLEDGVTITHVSLTAADDAGQVFEIASGDSAELTVDTDAFRSYWVSCSTYDLNGVYLNLNHQSFYCELFRQHTLKTLTAGDLLTFDHATYPDSYKKKYDLENGPEITYDDYGIDVTFTQLSANASLSGAIVDSENNPIPDASLTCSQTVNGELISVSSITDENGEYRFDHLYTDKPAVLAVSKTGYPNTTKTIDVNGNTVCTISMEELGGVTVTTSKDVYNVKLKWKGADSGVITSSGGYRFTLPVPKNVNGEITVTMSASNIAGEISGKVTVTKGKGDLTLEPLEKGTIDWTGVDDGYPSYTGYAVTITGDNYSKQFPAQNCGWVEVNPGTYTVSILQSGSNNAYATQTLTVEEDQTSYVTAALPSAAKPQTLSSGSIVGPRTASTGETYQLKGLITSADSKNIRGLAFMIGDTMSWSNNIDHVVINGKSAAIENGFVYCDNDLNKDIDWSLPLSFTVYCTQNATPAQLTQSVSAYLLTETKELIGTVVTKYVPRLSLRTVSTVGSLKNEASDQSFLSPSPVSFVGECAPNTEVRLYDNGTLCAVTTSDANGRYSGSLLLAGDERYHSVRAEADFGGSAVGASSSVTYSDDGAVLTSLEKNGVKIPINGDSIAYVTVPTGKMQFTATFDNADKLGDMTYTVNGEQVTSKVFFKVKTISGYKILSASSNKSGDVWTSQTFAHGVDYPVGVKVLYRSKKRDYSGSATFTDDEPASQGAAPDSKTDLAGTGASVSSTFQTYIERTDRYEGDYESAYDYQNWLKSVTGGMDILSDTSLSPSEMTNSMYERVASIMNSEAASGNSAKAITAKEAAERCPSGVANIRTYVDAPAYTVTAQNLQIRKGELEGKGYQSFCYKDRTSGHEVCVFKGTFYYDAYAKPVPSLTVEKVYNGIPTVEEDDRMYKDGKPLGSMLDVMYICDVTEKKWARVQTAVIAPNAVSPIHTYSTQVPSKLEQPNAYRESAVSPVSMAPDTLAATGAASPAATGEGPDGKSGWNYSVDFKKVSNKTYYSFAVSAGSCAAGGFMEANNIGVKFISPETAKKWNLVTETGEDVRKVIKYQNATADSVVWANNFYFMGMGVSAVSDGPAEPEDVFEAFRSALTQKMHWYGRVEAAGNRTNASNNGGRMGDFRDEALMAKLMKERCAEMQQKITKYQASIEDARNQGVLTGDITAVLGLVSAGVSLIPGWGFAAAFAIDAGSFYLNACADTRLARVIEEGEDLANDLMEFARLDNENIESIRHVDDIIKKNRDRYPDTKTMEELLTEDGKGDPNPPKPEENPAGDDGDGTENNSNTGNDCDLTPVHDPSGVVYEAVLSNPVEGASVTLYRYRNAQNPLVVWDDSNYLKQDNPLITDENGCYRWDVPEGDWYVTASKEGYTSGSSMNDVAAAVKHGAVNYLPVLPPQLEVNIPLVSYAAPEIESVSAKTDGVYVTFSKYMDEALLTKDHFTLTDASGNPVAFTLEKLDSEQAPANIRYSGTAPSYTRTVKLTANSADGTKLTLRISDALKSYAGVAMAAPYFDTLTVKGIEKLSEPTFSLEPGKIEKGTLVTIFCDDGAEIIYTTDGSEPTADNGIRAKNGVEVSLIIDTTLKAIAVRADALSSNTVAAEYYVNIEAPDAPAVSRILGDVDGDSDVTIIDATLIQRYLASLENSVFYAEVADTDADGEIAIFDATAIQRYLADLSHPDGIGQPV